MKSLAAILLLTFSTPVMAETWSGVGDFTNDQRLLVDLDSLTYANEDGTVVITGAFKFFGSNYVANALIDQKSCAPGEGPLAMTHGKQVDKYFFDIRAKKVYDYMGRVLCDYYAEQQAKN